MRSRAVSPWGCAGYLVLVFGVASAAPRPAPTVGQPEAAVAQPSNWTVLFADDFEDGTGDAWGVLLQDNQARGWFVEAEGAGHVFAGHGNAKASLTAGRWFDFRLKARVRISQGSLSLHYRSRECASYYVTLEPGAFTLTRWRPCGTRVGLARAIGSYRTGQWYTVEIVGTGANLKVYVDGTLTIDFTDPDPILFGAVAVETMLDSDAAVDDIEVTGPPEPPRPVWIKTGGPLGAESATTCACAPTTRTVCS